MYNKRKNFIAACVGLFQFGMTLITLGSILPELKTNFESSGISAATLAGLLPMGIMLGSLIFGPIVDRYGYKLLLIVSILITAIGLLGLAYGTTVSIIYSCVFLIGFGGGIINGGTTALVADISEDNKGASLSLLGVFYGIGALGMPLLLGIMTKYYDYTTILSVVGWLMIASLIYFMMIQFPSPKHSHGFPVKEGIALLNKPIILLCGFFLFFQSGSESLINNFTTSFLQQELKVSNDKALYALSFSLAGLTLGRFLLGYILKRVSDIKALATCLSVIVIGNIVLHFTRSYPIAFTSLILTGMGLAGGFPILLGFIGQLFPTLSGTAFSILYVIALLGNTLINYGFGLFSDKYGVNFLPLSVLLTMVCMLLLLILIHKNIKSKINT